MRLAKTTVLSALLTATASLWAAPLSIVHTWTSPSEEKALTVLEKDLEKRGLNSNFVIPEPNQLADSEAIRAFAKSMNRQPTFVSLSNEELRHWYDLRLLHSLTPIAKQQDWAASIPANILKVVTHRGQLIAAPVSVHSSNWLWANKALVDASGIPLNNDWTTFLTLVKALQEQGVVPIAHDGSQEQDILLFETLYLADFGAERYLALFESLDATQLRKAVDDFATVFEKLGQLKPYIQRYDAQQGWQHTASLLTGGEAALVIQGDWIHGEFARQGRLANQHYYCVEFPGEHATLSFRVDAIASLNENVKPMTAAHQQFFASATDKNMQYLFNNYKGGLPAISDTGLEAVSECLSFGVQRTQNAIANNALVPSLSQGMAVRDVVKREIGQVISDFMTSEQTPQEAAKLLQKRIKYASYLIN